MAFVIAGPHSQVCIDSVDEPLLGQLPQRYGLRTPRCDYLWERFYDDPRIGSPAEVALLRAEIEALRAAHARHRGDELARERKVPPPRPCRSRAHPGVAADRRSHAGQVRRDHRRLR
jgi:hypothetical protein